jgi:hypothetical protein
VINGFVGIKEIGCIASQNFRFVLISRKLVKRQGVRYIVRGNDENGYSANFAETEELLFYKESEESQLQVLSYYIIRGSVPLYWSQNRDLKYNPIVRIN